MRCFSLSFPIIAFLYTPNQFGTFTVYGALLAFLGILATMRYEMAIPIAESDQEAKSLVHLVTPLDGRFLCRPLVVILSF